MKHITIQEITDLNIQAMLNNPSNRNGTAGRQITDTLNNFSIEDSLGVYIKIGDYDSYTFKIYRPNAPRVPLENLVISKTETGYEALLYIYDITEEELHKIETHQNFNLEGKVYKKLLSNDDAATLIASKNYYNGNCYEEIFIYMQPTKCGTGRHSFGDVCDLDPLYWPTSGGYVLTTTLIPCNSGGSGATGPAPGSSPTTSGGSSGGVKGGTTPVSQSPQYMRKKKFSQNNAACLSQLSVETLTPIFNYLETGNIQGTIMLELGASATTYPQDRLDIVAEALEKMCQDPETFTSIVPFLIEDQIVDNLDPCGQSVLTKLKNLQQSDIANILSRFNVTKTYNLSFITASPINIAWGSTTWATTAAGNVIAYNYIIKLPSIVQSTSTELAIAEILLHEMLHAYFLSLVDDCRMQGQGGCNTLQTFPEVWNLYVAWQNGGPNIVTTISQHEQMALSYVDHIASALQEYQTGISVVAGQSPQLYFLDLAWAGLLGTPAYNNLANVDRARIELQWVAETTNQPATVNGQTAYPVGTRNNACQ